MRTLLFRDPFTEVVTDIDGVELRKLQVKKPQPDHKDLEVAPNLLTAENTAWPYKSDWLRPLKYGFESYIV